MEKIRSKTNNDEMVSISRAEYESMQAQIQWLMEQLRLSRRKQFGSSSEKSTDEGMEQLSLLFDEAEVYTARKAPSLWPWQLMSGTGSPAV